MVLNLRRMDTMQIFAWLVYTYTGVELLKQDFIELGNILKTTQVLDKIKVGESEFKIKVMSKKYLRNVCVEKHNSGVVFKTIAAAKPSKESEKIITKKLKWISIDFSFLPVTILKALTQIELVPVSLATLYHDLYYLSNGEVYILSAELKVVIDVFTSKFVKPVERAQAKSTLIKNYITDDTTIVKGMIKNLDPDTLEALLSQFPTREDLEEALEKEIDHANDNIKYKKKQKVSSKVVTANEEE